MYDLPTYRTFTLKNTAYWAPKLWATPLSPSNEHLDTWEQQALNEADHDHPYLQHRRLVNLESSGHELDPKQARQLRKLNRRANSRQLPTPCYTQGTLLSNWTDLHQIPVPAEQTHEQIFVRNKRCSEDPNCTNPRHWDAQIDVFFRDQLSYLADNNYICYAQIDRRFGRRSDRPLLTETQEVRQMRASQLATRAQLDSVLHARNYSANIRKYDELTPVPLRPMELSMIAAFRRLGTLPERTLDLLGFQHVDRWVQDGRTPGSYATEALRMRDSVLAESGVFINKYEINTSVLHDNKLNYLRPTGLGEFVVDIETMLRRTPPYFNAKILKDFPDLDPWYWLPFERMYNNRPQQRRGFNT